MKTRLRDPFPFHPFLFALNPIIVLYSSNTGEVSLGELIRPAVITLAAAAVLLLVLRWVLRDGLKAAVIVSGCIVAFFYYGHLFQGLPQDSSAVYAPLVRHRFMLPAWLLLIAAGVRVAGAKRRLRTATLFLNALGVILLAIPVVTIATHGTARNADIGARKRWQRAVVLDTQHLRLRPKKPLRDIYYIILDEYSRADVLKACFDCDNSEFLDHLRAEGFYVAGRSLSNYTYTYASLASSLDMDYVQSLVRIAGGEPSKHTLIEMIRENRACRYLKSLGYKFVFFPTEYQMTSSNPNADVVITSNLVTISEFERMLINNSILQPIYANERAHRRGVLHALRELERIPEIKEPTFTFAHIICPHKSYVFDANGRWPANPSAPNQEWRLYADQVHFISRRIEGIVERIISRSPVRPIIILQGDHGTWCMPRYSRPGLVSRDVVKGALGPSNDILNVYLLPEGGNRLLYESISPVNSFRVIFNEYFGASYKLLPDESFSVQWRPDGSAKYVHMPISSRTAE